MTEAELYELMKTDDSRVHVIVDFLEQHNLMNDVAPFTLARIVGMMMGHLSTDREDLEQGLTIVRSVLLKAAEHVLALKSNSIQ